MTFHGDSMGFGMVLLAKLVSVDNFALGRKNMYKHLLTHYLDLFSIPRVPGF